MNLVKTFQAIEETRFLKKLSLLDNLFFVGEAEALNYIQNFFAHHKQCDRNFYYDLPNHSLNNLPIFFQNCNSDRSIIVVSMEQEASLFLQVKQIFADIEEVTIVRLFADVFINLVCHTNPLQLTSDEFIEPKTSYAVLTTPRSGSTYFCELLGSTGIAGYPIEHLRAANQELALNCNFDYFRLLYNLMQHRVTENGVFGTKLISHFLFELRQAKPRFKNIFKTIDNYILLVRKDKVAQAVSLVLAQKTNVWHIQKHVSQHNPDYLGYQAALENIEIDDKLLAEVKQKHQFVKNQENRLRNMLRVNQIEPLEIVYEDIMENAAAQIIKVLNFLEISLPSHQAIRLDSEKKKMPSELSQAIIRQYRQQNKKSTVSSTLDN